MVNKARRGEETLIAFIGGIPSEPGMIRYERDVLRIKEDGEPLENPPDIVIVEFGVNDDGDETKGKGNDFP